MFTHVAWNKSKRTGSANGLTITSKCGRFVIQGIFKYTNTRNFVEHYIVFDAGEKVEQKFRTQKEAKTYCNNHSFFGL